MHIIRTRNEDLILDNIGFSLNIGDNRGKGVDNVITVKVS